MKTRVVTAEPGEPARAAWARMRARRIRHLVVTDSGEVVGVLSESDLAGQEGARDGRTVGELMTARAVEAKPATTLERAATLMHERKIGSLPVTEAGRLVGIVTATDVLEELGRTATRSRERQRVRPGRARGFTPDSKRRAPFADRLPRPFRREAGRPRAPLVPTYILGRGGELDQDDRDYIRRKLGMKLGKFASFIERVSVRVEDVNGPRSGVDQRCRIKVVLRRLPSVVVEAQDAVMERAIDGALAKVERAVRRVVERRQTRGRA